MLRGRTLMAIASGGLLGPIAACGASGTSDPGHWIGATADAGPSDATLDLSDAWPTADPDPDGGVHGGPHFGSDAGEAGAGPSTFACSGKTLSAGDTAFSLMSGGLTRSGLLHVPASYDASLGSMLVLNFHGYTSNSAEEVVLTRMNASSDARGYIVAYPDGVGASWNAGDCCGDAWNNSVDDVQFVRDLLARLESEYCIDPKRVFATGMSNGGFFSHRLGCDLSDKIAAIAPVAGVLGIPRATCNPRRPVPVLEFHGTADPIVPYNGGTPISPVNFGGPVVFRSVVESIAAWRTKNDCLGTGKNIYSQGDATCVDYDTCSAGADVTLCTIDGGGHTWPGGVPIAILGKTSTDISATDTMIDFFAAHPMP